MICLQCGSGFDRRVSGVHKFCSNACRQKSYRSRRKQRAVSSHRWVRAKGKRPIQVNGAPASTTNPATWSTWSAIRRSSAGDGFGVMLGWAEGDTSALGCYDFDDCFVDGELKSWASDALEKISEPIVFSEVSMSGKGLHVFFRADAEGRGVKLSMPDGGGLERYTAARFIRMTLDPYPPLLGRHRPF